MKYPSIICFFLVQFTCFNAPAQEIFLDTFLRNTGIHIVPPFQPWQQATLFPVKTAKGKIVAGQPLLHIEACDRVKLYSGSAFGDKKTEPFLYFRVLADLQAHDSIAYFEGLAELPPAYRSFFSGLFHVEYNQFKTALSFFDNALITPGSDSLVVKEASFWKTATQKLSEDFEQYNAVFHIYATLESLEFDSAVLMRLVNQVSLPQYKVHKYVGMYNYYYRKKNYGLAAAVYDSILAYASQSKMKASLAKNRNAMLELLQAKQMFIKAISNDLYHYEMDYLYDHLEAWAGGSLTDSAFSAEAGFILNKQFTNKSDSIFTRWLKDTAINETLSKFEVLSFTKTPFRSGRRFVIVKLGFNNEGTYKKYAEFLEKFKNKPVQQSVLQFKTSILEGNEYMLTKYFIAALCLQDDPVIKYELTLYMLEDEEGNPYAVDTLF